MRSRAAVRREVSSASSWGEPLPLQSPSVKARAYPLEHLPKVVRNAVVDMEAVIQAPMPLIAASVLASINLAVQPHADIKMDDGRRLPASLFLLTVAQSGDRKSTCDKVVMQPHLEREKELLDAFDTKRAAYENDLRAWKLRHEKIRKEFLGSKSSGPRNSNSEELEARLRELGPEPRTPIMPMLIARDATIEGLTRQLLGYPSIGVFSDEAATFFNGYSMKEENALRTQGLYCELWDGKGVNRIRVSDCIAARGKRLAMHLLLQPIVYERSIADNEVLEGQGFLARCLISRVESTIGQREYKRESVLEKQGVKDLHNILTEILRKPLPIRPGSSGELDPLPYEPTEATYDLYADMCDRLERAQAIGGPYEEIRSWASKAAEQALRLAVTLEIAQNPHGSSVITPESFKAARCVIEYHLSEVLRAKEEGKRCHELSLADKTWQWLVREGRQPFTLTWVQQHGPNQIRRGARQLGRLLDILVEHNLLRKIRAPNNPKRFSYEMNPEAVRRYPPIAK